MINHSERSITVHHQLERLINQYGKMLMNFAYTYLNDWSLSEDAVQEVFIKWYKKADTFQDASAIKTWLYKTTANQCKDMLRKSKSRFNLFKKLKEKREEKIAQASEDLYIIKDEQTAIEKEVLALPIIYREVVILYYYEEYSTTEISKLLSINISTVKTRLARARDLLKGRLEGGAVHE